MVIKDKVLVIDGVCYIHKAFKGVVCLFDAISVRQMAFALYQFGNDRG